MTARNRYTAAALAVLFAAALILSAAFTAHSASHECCGEGCAVCETVSQCAALLAGAAAAVFTAAAVSVSRRICMRIGAVRQAERRSTPVSEKVLLLN